MKQRQTLDDEVGEQTAELGRRARDLSILYGVSSTINRSLDVQEIVEQGLEQLLEATRFVGGWIRLAPDEGDGSGSLLVTRAVGDDVIGRLAKQEHAVLAGGGATCVYDEPGDGQACPDAGRGVACTPIALRASVIGTLNVIGGPAYRFSAADVRLFASVAEQVGVAVGNARAYAATRERERQARILYQTIGRFGGQPDLDSLLTAVIEGAVAAIGASSGGVGLPDGDELVMRPLSVETPPSPPVIRLKISNSLAGLAFLTGRPQMSNHPAHDPRVGPVTREAGIRNFICTPLHIADRVIGVLFVLDKASGPFTDADLTLFTTFASYAAVAIENARLHAETIRRERETSILYRTSSRINEQTDIDDLLTTIVEAAIEITDATWGGIGQPSGNEVVVRPLVGGPRPGVTERRIPSAGSAARMVFETGEPVIVNDLDHSPLSPEIRERARADGLTNFLCAPLKSKAIGGTVGLIKVCNKHGGLDFTADDLRLLTTFAAHAAMALDSARLFQEMKATKDYLEHLIESSVDAIVTTDGRGHITFVSRGGQRMVGDGETQLLGQPVWAYWVRGRRDFNAFRGRLARDGRVQNYETDVRATDGRALTVNISAARLKASDGRPSGVVAVVKDVTDLRRLHEQMVRSERLAAAGLLAAGVAHEIGNAVTCASSLCQMLTAKTAVPEVRRGLGDIQVHVDRIARIVQDLSRLTRPRSFEIAATSLNGLVEHAVHLARHNPAARQMRIVTEFEAGTPTVRASADHLLQVFLNIVLNAADAGGDLTIVTSGNDRNARVVFRDTGCGMPPEQLARLFDPFSSTKDDHPGLGLFVSNEIVRHHGGTIVAESRPGAGSTVTVVLPVERPPGPED